MYNLLTHTYMYLPLGEGATCIHTTVNPTSLCYALLYPLSRPSVYCSSSRRVETLPPYRFFFSSFPLSRTDRGSRGKRRFLFRVGTRKKRESDRHGATFANDVLFFIFVFPSLHTRPCSLHVVDWRHVFVKEGKKERGRGGV